MKPTPKDDIRLAWYHYRAKHQDNTIEALRDFLSKIVADLEAQSTACSPQEYAQIFDTMNSIVQWEKLSPHIQNVRVPIIISMGILAGHSGNEKSRTGVRISTEYMRQVKTISESVRFRAMHNTNGHEPIVDIVNSPLLPEYKLRLLKECAFQETWLIADLADKIQRLLPGKERELFKYFPWSDWDLAENKNMIREFLPSLYPLLELSLSDGDWMKKAAVTKTLKSIAPVSKTKAKRTAFDLPIDFLG